MRIAVTYDFDTKEVFQHFGQTQNFLLVDTFENKENVSMIVNNEGYSHAELVDYLRHLEVNVLICGGLGNRAISLLSQAGIEVVPGILGNANEAVERYLKGELDGDMSVLHDCDCEHHH